MADAGPEPTERAIAVPASTLRPFAWRRFAIAVVGGGTVGIIVAAIEVATLITPTQMPNVPVVIADGGLLGVMAGSIVGALLRVSWLFIRQPKASSVAAAVATFLGVLVWYVITAPLDVGLSLGGVALVTSIGAVVNALAARAPAGRRQRFDPQAARKSLAAQ